MNKALLQKPDLHETFFKQLEGHHDSLHSVFECAVAPWHLELSAAQAPGIYSINPEFSATSGAFVRDA